jgi:hypothetical protein
MEEKICIYLGFDYCTHLKSGLACNEACGPLYMVVIKEFEIAQLELITITSSRTCLFKIGNC